MRYKHKKYDVDRDAKKRIKPVFTLLHSALKIFILHSKKIKISNKNNKLGAFSECRLQPSCTQRHSASRPRGTRDVGFYLNVLSTLYFNKSMLKVYREIPLTYSGIVIFLPRVFAWNLGDVL